MDTKPDPTTCRRLAREAREDDARMTPEPWISESMTTRRDYGVISGPSWPVAQICFDDDRRPVTSEFDPGQCVIGDINAIARTRNNLPEVARQLEAAAEMAGEVERLRALDATSEALCEQRLLQIHDLTRERDAARAEADRLRARVAELEAQGGR